MYIVGFLVCFNFQGLFEQKKKQQPNLKEKIRSLQHICINHSTCNGYAEKPIFHF